MHPSRVHINHIYSNLEGPTTVLSKGWILGYWDDVIGILDGDYVICDDFLLY